MKKFSKKGVLLFVGAMAVCAFALPAVSSAASWAGSTHSHLVSPDIGFTSSTAAGPLTSSCTNSFFTTRTDSASILTITTGAFSGCTSTAPAAGAHCLTTSTPTNFPWIATATATNNIQIHGVRVDIRFEHFGPTANCVALQGAQTLLTGTISGGSWIPTTRELIFTDAPGLTSHPALNAAFVRGTFRSTGNTLQVLD